MEAVTTETDIAPLLYETHMHTPLCNHAYGQPGEYAEVARQRGLKGIIVTCHCPMPNSYSANVRMTPGQFPEYLDLVQRTREEWAGRVDVLTGLESDYLPGTESWLEKLHSRAELNHVLGSVHPQVGEYQRLYFKGDIVEYQKLYFTHLAEAAETGLFDTLSHPDLIKNESPADWDIERIWSHLMKCLDRIAETGCAMELNTSGFYKRIQEMNPCPEMLVAMCERGIPVVVGADAHAPERVADRFPEAFDLLESCGYSAVNIFIKRERQEIPISLARDSLLAARA